MSFLNDLANQNNLTETENGAVALKSTMNRCLDAFGSIGGMMGYPAETIVDTFVPAFIENRELAMRMLFYFRDIRGGQGMRQAFRGIVKYLANTYPEYIVKNLHNFPEYGRWDDLLCLIDTPLYDEVMVFLRNQFEKDILARLNGDITNLW